MLSAVAADDYAAVHGGAAVFYHGPEALYILIRLILAEDARLQVAREVGAEVIVQAAVVDDARQQGVEPEKLHSVVEILGWAVLHGLQALGHAQQLTPPLGRGGLRQAQGLLTLVLGAVYKDIEAAKARAVEAVFRVFSQLRLQLAPQAADAVFKQQGVVEHHTAEPRRRYERRLAVYEAADDVVDERLVAILRLEVVLAPVIVERVYAGAVRIT